MTSAEIRQSFLDFFKSKQHTIVPSSSLMPDSPNLLFTNAGMNQFVPIFLGQRAPDVAKWAGAIPGSDTRAADTQKCIRAGGKHNDLEDVGLDTYHHTFFEMLGNWSFGDYFKKEAIDWAWELVTEVWKFPKNRLYATVYSPDKAKGDPSEFDQEAYDLWAEKFRAAGLDPAGPHRQRQQEGQFLDDGRHRPVRPVPRTPRGPHARRATPRARSSTRAPPSASRSGTSSSSSSTPTRTAPSRRCPPSTSIPAWASSASPASSRARKDFTDFARVISNYETDIFRPIFDELEKLSGKKYGSTLPGCRHAPATTEQEKIDVAFRVIADHIRTLSFAIADGIQPGNTDRNYVLRRILRRAVRYGRTLGFHEPFFYKLVDVLADTMGDVFPEIRAKQEARRRKSSSVEEEAFNKTLDRGIELFEKLCDSDAEDARTNAEAQRTHGMRAVEFRAISPSSSTTPTASRSTSPN